MVSFSFNSYLARLMSLRIMTESLGTSGWTCMTYLCTQSSPDAVLNLKEKKLARSFFEVPREEAADLEGLFAI